MVPEAVERRIKRIENIATLPHVANRILEMTQRETSSMRQIAQVIEQDPSITAKLLKIANSPIWGYPGRVDSLQRALVLLGLKQVTSIVVSIGLYSTFARLSPNPHFNREKFWLHSVGTSQIARALTKMLHLQFHGEEFVTALIHDLGKIILDQFFNKEFQQILQQAHHYKQPILHWEKAILGTTHAEIGAWVLQKWNFPPHIIQAVQFHHTPNRATRSNLLTAIIRLSEILCETWGIGFDEDVTNINLQEDSSWIILNESTQRMHQLDIERFLFQMEKQMNQARMFIQIIEA